MSCGSLLLTTTMAVAALSMSPVDGFSTLPTRTGSSCTLQPLKMVHCDHHEYEYDNTPTAGTSRRDMLATSKSAVLGALCGWILEPNARRMGLLPRSAMAAYVTDPNEAPSVSSADNIPSFVAGTVTIPSNFDFDEAQAKTRLVDPTGKTMTPVPALYVTVRPDKPDNVPQAILQGTRGKPPPVLSARFERPSFPFSFHLTDKDFTLEGQPAEGEEDPWWLRDDLIVSARLDMDGIAATRSPEDLVGRTTYQRSKGGEAVELNLMGRGAFGKFATQQQKN